MVIVSVVFLQDAVAQAAASKTQGSNTLMSVNDSVQGSSSCNGVSTADACLTLAVELLYRPLQCISATLNCRHRQTPGFRWHKRLSAISD